MALTDINSVIASLATPGGIVVLSRPAPDLVRGRRTSTPMTVTTLTDVVWAPDAGGRTAPSQGGVVSPTEQIAIYSRVDIAPALKESGQPSWVVAGGRTFEVLSSEPWTPGGFWVAKARLVADSANVGIVGFGILTTAQAALAVDVVAGILRGKLSVRSSQRAMRFSLASGDSGVSGNVVGFVWPSSVVGSTDTIVARAVNASDVVVELVALEVRTLGADTVATFARVVDSAGRLRFEVL